MARSVFYFVHEIERREHELRESHAGLEEQVAARTAELKRLSNRLLQAQEEERFKLAAELHDDIGATMGVLQSIISASHLHQNASILQSAISASDCDTYPE